MLKLRVLTATILIPLVVFLIYYPDARWFSLFFAGITLLAAWEWGALCRFGSLSRYAYCALMLTLLTVFYAIDISQYLIWLLAGAGMFWFAGVLLVLLYQQQRNLLPRSRLLLSLIGIVLLVPMWSALVYLKTHVANGATLIMFLMLLIWSADSGAYFVGRKWGRHKLASRVSPGKTWEGILGGLICGLIICAGYLILFGIEPVSMFGFTLLSLITILISVTGDLLESMVKREANIKDSGKILPGHGGILDRIDSLTAAAPVFTAGAIYLGVVQ